MKKYTIEADTYYQPSYITRFSQTWAPIIAFGLLIVAFACMGILVSLMAYVGLYHRTPSAVRTSENAGQVDLNQQLLVFPTVTPVLVGEESLQPVFASASSNSNEAASNTDGEIVNELDTLPIPLSFAGLEVPASIEQREISAEVEQNLARLLAESFPARDYFDTHVRLGGADTARILTEPVFYQVGDTRQLSVLGEPVNVRLASITPNLYFWVDEDLSLSDQIAVELSNEIEAAYLPPIFNLFGREWIPGIDLDPHINIVHLASLNSEELGFFDSSDEYPTSVFAESNQHEAVYINMADLTPGDEFYFGTVVHEIQHLIQWNNDKNEETWLDEGLSQLAEVYSGLDSFEVIDYLNYHDIQLNTWSYDSTDVYSHYSGSALFMIYFYEQLGAAAVTDLAQNRLDGMAAIADVVERRSNLTFEEFLSNWFVALHLNGTSVDARYNYDYAFTPIEVDYRVSSNQLAEQNSLHQFSSRYIALDGGKIHHLSFAGDTLHELAPIPPYAEHAAGSLVWYAPPANKLNSKLVTEIDLTGIADLTLTYDIWFEFENNYDFLYVMVSADGGNSWETLNTRYSTNSLYGPGITGRSADQGAQNQGWVTDSISLDRYRNQVVQLKFEVVTDSTNADGGVAIDNIQIGNEYFNDLESGGEGWASDGFVHVRQALPQSWSVQLIRYGETITVESLPLDELNQGRWILNLSDPATIVIAPITPFTQELGSYWLYIDSR